MKPVFHSSTKKAIDDFIKSPSHALLITGPQGAGKGTAACYIGSQILGIDPEKLTDHPFVLWLRDLDKGVSIENIRTAQTFMQLKTPGKANIRRILIVEQGETMSLEAQNAFLKLLEEPPRDTLIIITSSSSELLLPTIESRVQNIKINSPNKAQLEKYFKDKYDDASIIKAYYTCEGHVGLMHALLNEETEHPLIDLIALSKQLLGSSTFDRLARIDELSKQKDVSLLLRALERVCHAALSQAIESNQSTAKRWAERLKAVLEAREYLSKNVQTKLLLTNLMLNL